MSLAHSSPEYVQGLENIGPEVCKMNYHTISTGDPEIAVSPLCQLRKR